MFSKPVFKDTTFAQFPDHKKICVEKCTGILDDDIITGDCLHFSNRISPNLSNLGLSIFDVLQLRQLQRGQNFEHPPLQFCYIWTLEHIPYRRPDAKIYEDFGIMFNPIGNIMVSGPACVEHCRYVQLLELLQLDLLVNMSVANDLGRTFCLGGFPWNGLGGTFIIKHYDDYYRNILTVIHMSIQSDWLNVNNFSLPPFQKKGRSIRSELIFVLDFRQSKLQIIFFIFVVLGLGANSAWCQLAAVHIFASRPWIPWVSSFNR